jgi:hypothetical protein
VTYSLRAILFGLLTLAGCADPPPPDPGPPVATIYVVERGWHTDIGLPARGLGPLRPFEHEFPGARFFVFGFGEKNYLQARDPTPGLMLRALFPGEGLILVTALNASPAQAFAAYRVLARPISADGLERLTRFIAASIEWTAAGRPRLAAQGPYDGSLFYASRVSYSLFDTCNTWTARALQAAGEPVSAAGVITASQLLDQLAPASDRALSAPRGGGA